MEGRRVEGRRVEENTGEESVKKGRGEVRARVRRGGVGREGEYRRVEKSGGE